MEGLELKLFLGLTCGLLAVAVLVILRRPLLCLGRLGVRTALGLGALAVFSRAGGLIGVTLGVNLANALALGLLGVPGFGLLLLLNWAVS
ncbi:MAG: pro-sigmaK processing inhibitor BofA family protein [Intestinimonas sp.]|jgi:inhibitor of the pro-sigma K processing machinery|nr:pro-sigmaK processing inhibitor BofA family protein [Intestinimonas sp.]